MICLNRSWLNTIDIKEKRDRWIKSLQKDIYVDEAMNLLKDLSSIEGNEILSQINKID